MAEELQINSTHLWQYLLVGLGQALYEDSEGQSALQQTFMAIEETLHSNVPDRNFEDLLPGVLFHLEDVIAFNNSDLCSWDEAERQIPCQKDWFREVLTLSGNCFNFNYMSNFSQVKAGSSAALRMAVNIYNHLNSGMYQADNSKFFHLENEYLFSI